MKILLGIVLLGYMIFGAVSESPNEKNLQENKVSKMNVGKGDTVQSKKVVYLDADGKLIED
ncbi:hypothetical protein [Chryseolinea sp. H1M3-3]|uniref:hypothetical protein n=1 Tax=Chryseolinea sp. H1M3-3 TaxID=3034144 RepID=UPI0023EC801D|nr:hypothetical protein [Chryseolinea sp. H1M3-3]